jgi:hypothetical protein
MMTVLFTCKKCGSGIYVYPNVESKKIVCEVCQQDQEVNFNEDHTNGILKDCPGCARKDFYSQKDFNRKIGVILFIITAIISTVLFAMGFGPQWYLSTFIILYVLDFLLFRKLNMIAICYKCEAIFRDVKNISDIPGFNHEMHDRILYKNHDFQGKHLDHH